MKTKACKLYSKRHLGLIGYLLLLQLVWGCTEIFEPELSEEFVELIAPPHESTSSELTQTFWWTSVEYAEEYNFQLVSPSFLSTHQILTDTITTDLKTTLILEPGNYEWRVAALNSSSQTSYSTFNLTVDSSSLITTDSIKLLSPHSNDTSNLELKIFKWLYISTATSYEFNLYYENDLVYSEETENDTLALMLDWSDGTYKWEVRGQNEVNHTPFVSRTFYLDTKAPTIPILLTPVNNLELYDTIVKFSWSKSEDNGSDIWDHILVYGNQELTDVKIDKITKDSQFDSYLEPGTYYWRVRSVDVAGNESAFSQARKINVKSRSLTNEYVLLVYPLVNDTINKTLIPFTWLAVTNATSYQFKLFHNSVMGYEITSSEPQAEMDLIWGEGAYQWEVQALNDFSSTAIFQRSFYVDITPPGIPELISPENNLITTDSVQNFKWIRPTNIGSSVHDSLYIYRDSLRTNLLLKKMVNATNYEFELELGNYFWSIQSVDAVGNKSEFSSQRKITIIKNEE